MNQAQKINLGNDLSQETETSQAEKLDTILSELHNNQQQLNRICVDLADPDTDDIGQNVILPAALGSLGFVSLSTVGIAFPNLLKY